MFRRSRDFFVCAVALSLAAPLAGQGTSTASNPIVVFGTPGNKQVSLSACDSVGCDTEMQTVTVLNPVPVVVSAIASPGIAEVGDLIRLDGVGSGAPPLTYTWQIASGVTPIATLPGATAWWDTSGRPAGVYTAQLTVSNGFASVPSLVI